MGLPDRQSAATLIAVLLAVTTAGCSASAGASPPSRQDSPAAVGLAYSKHLFAGEFDQAATYVLPADRSLLKALFTGSISGSIRSEDLGVGTVSVRGDKGDIVLTGKLCSSGAASAKAGTSTARPNDQCLENHDPKSQNPAFQLSVCKTADAWYVCFPKAGGVGRQNPDSPVASSAAPAKSTATGKWESGAVGDSLNRSLFDP